MRTTNDVSKFNVSKNVNERTFDNISFASKLEMRFYQEVVLPKVGTGEIKTFQLQRPYELLPTFVHNGKKIRSIVYVADFYLVFDDGREEVIDTKGFADATAKLKRKLFWYKYPNINYRWVTYVKKYGGWIDYDEYQKLKHNNSK